MLGVMGVMVFIFSELRISEEFGLDLYFVFYFYIFYYLYVFHSVYILFTCLYVVSFISALLLRLDFSKESELKEANVDTSNIADDNWWCGHNYESGALTVPTLAQSLKMI